MGIDLLQGFEADDVDAAVGFGVLLTLGKNHVLLQGVSFLCCQLQPLLWPSLFPQSTEMAFKSPAVAPSGKKCPNVAVTRRLHDRPVTLGQ